jgi:hypothetical protein
MNALLRIVVLAGLLAAAAVTSGCVIPAPPARMTVSAPTVVASGGYSPMQYEGYVVYYDDYGRPMYYVNGAPYYVPTSYPHYHSYVTHYNAYGVAYRNWYGSYGVRYHNYRAPGVRTVVRHTSAPPPAPVVRYAPGPRVVVRPAPAPAPTVIVRPAAPPPRRVIVRPAPRPGAPPPPPSPPR